jgi:adenine-specific DNA-methyltransferase
MPTLNWIGKEAVVNHDKEVPFRLLKKVKSASVGENSQNLIIHGDNLEALKALMPYYSEKIKCIYIDPPYNTGSENWKYNDKVNSPKIKKWLGSVVGGQSDDLCRHDKWLCMMYPRIKLLRELMRGDGLIFISINSIELNNLKILLDEIFGEENFIQIVSMKVATTASFRAINACPVNVSEYLIIYGKNKSLTNIVYKESKYSEDYSQYIENFDGPALKWKIKNVDELIYNNEKVKDWKEFKNKYGESWKEIRYQLKAKFCSDNRERIVSLNTLQKPSKDIQKIVDESKNTKGKVFEFKRSNKDSIYVYNGRTLAFYKNKFKSINGKEVVSEILTNIWDDISFLSLGHEGNVDFFNGKKPIALIKRVLQLSTDTDSLILDSFAGSGSTAHGVLDLNKDDGGKRQFILVEMEDYAKDITATRVKNVIEEYKYNDGFEYCELDKPLFNEEGQIEESCEFNQFATYIYFTETQTNIDKSKIEKNYIGENGNSEFYLIYKEKDKNILTKSFLSKLRKTGNKKIVYADKNYLDEDVLLKYNIIFKQIPYEVKVY